jgi:hypothetical protein
MDASDLVAVCSVVIAVAALAVSGYQSWLARDHNRRSVRPALQFASSWRAGSTAGLQLSNVGLGPALVTKSTVWLDGTLIGPFNHDASEILRGPKRPRPNASTFTAGAIFPTGYRNYLLSVEDYDFAFDRHSEFTALIADRLTLEIDYTSLYEKQTWTARWPDITR